MKGRYLRTSCRENSCVIEIQQTFFLTNQVLLSKAKSLVSSLKMNGLNCNSLIGVVC